MTARPTRPPDSGSRTTKAVRDLAPSYFAVVMATGVLSVDLHDHSQDALSTALLWFAAVAYVLLVVLHGWRIASYGGTVRRDLSDPTRGFGFFTFVAGTNVLGTRLALDGRLVAALVLLVIGCLGGLLLGYAVPSMALLSRHDTPVVGQADGSWLMWAVASQSVAVLTATVEPSVGFGRSALALVAIGAWSVGCALYIVVAVIVVFRLLSYDTKPDDVGPVYWVAMGAAAITVLAGSQIATMASAPAVAATRDLVAAISIVFWTFGTWLIPALLAVGWWRHVTHRIPLRYDPSVWSMVFPIAMYAAATLDLGRTDHLPVSAPVAAIGTWIALGCWLLAAVAMVAHLVRTLARRHEKRATG